MAYFDLEIGSFRKKCQSWDSGSMVISVIREQFLSSFWGSSFIPALCGFSLASFNLRAPLNFLFLLRGIAMQPSGAVRLEVLKSLAQPSRTATGAQMAISHTHKTRRIYVNPNQFPKISHSFQSLKVYKGF